MKHVCYIENGSIINAFTRSVIERPAILISKKDDILFGWGNLETVEAKFETYRNQCARAGVLDEQGSLSLIELSEYKITREMAAYVIRRAAEFTATGFIKKLGQELTEGTDPIAWLKAEMERIPIDITEKEWR